MNTPTTLPFSDVPVSAIDLGADTEDVVFDARDQFTLDQLYDDGLPKELYAVYCAIEWIDVERAVEYLKHNIEPSPDKAGTNRPSYDPNVKKFAGQMVADEWLFTHQAIGFNTKGQLIDGAHRLKSILYAAKTHPNIQEPFLVVRNVPDASNEVIDLVRRRTAGDFLTMDGFKYGRTIAKAIKLIYLYRNNDFDAKIVRSYWQNTDVSTHDIRAIAAELEQQLKTYVVLASAMSKYLNPSASLAAMCILTGAYDTFKVAEFYHGVQNPAKINDGDARFALRNWGINRKNKANGATRTEPWEVLGVTFKAFSKWRNGATVQALTLREDEKFPRP